MKSKPILSQIVNSGDSISFPMMRTMGSYAVTILTVTVLLFNLQGVSMCLSLFKNYPGYSAGHVGNYVEARNPAECAVKCSGEPSCSAFAYQPTAQECLQYDGGRGKIVLYDNSNQDVFVEGKWHVGESLILQKCQTICSTLLEKKVVAPHMNRFFVPPMGRNWHEMYMWH